ncbi:MAG: hypothetical protein U0457_09290 [Candidatus Sericytochromatia bacterium]
MENTNISTLVIGAGPAGLLFCVISKILYEKQEFKNKKNWSIFLFDKRDSYIRNHRLRIAKENYINIQKKLNDPNFDNFINFLEKHHFKPEVNILEDFLLDLANKLGIKKEIFYIETKQNLIDLVKKIELENNVKVISIIGSDSVHSTIRELIQGELKPITYTHQTVVRLKIFAQDLPEKLSLVKQYKLSKVLTSLIDYRLNSNGFAEIDLFLDASEHEELQKIEASPKNPVKITNDIIKKLKTPIFSRFIYQFNKNISHENSEILLYSTFKLEHQYIKKVSFNLQDIDIKAFLVGDAAVSLPFFRGMACLGISAFELANNHIDFIFNNKDILKNYQSKMDEIIKKELLIVTSRANLIYFAKEFCRISNLLPFPLQTWFLSFPEPEKIDAKFTAGFAFNLGLAILALSLILIEAFLYKKISIYFSFILFLASIIQILGGLCYRATEEFEPSSDSKIRLIWRTQIFSLMVFGLFSILFLQQNSNLDFIFYSTIWFVFGLFFVLGIYLFESLGKNWFSKAEFEDTH